MNTDQDLSSECSHSTADDVLVVDLEALPRPNAKKNDVSVSPTVRPGFSSLFSVAQEVSFDSVTQEVGVTPLGALVG